MKKAQTTKINKRTVGFVVAALAWVTIAMAASQYIIGLPMLWILQENFSKPFWTCIYYALYYGLALYLILVFPKLIGKRQPKAVQQELATNPSELGFKSLPTFVDIGLAPIGYVVYLIGANALVKLFSLLPWFDSAQEQYVGFGYFITTADRIFAMIAIVLIAPIAEEIIMRGWLYGKLRTKLKIPLAMLLVSLLFGILHGQWNVGVGVFFLSLVLCGLREITGTVWSGILLHIIVNGITFYIVYISGF